MKLTIDTDDLKALAKEGKDITLQSSAEVALLNLLEIRQRVEEALDYAQSLINEEANKFDVNWKVIKSDHLKIQKIKTGQRYDYDPEKTSKDFISKRVTHYLDSGKIDEYVETNDRLPEGVFYKERGERIKINELEN